jgi:hypothetical protein
MDWVQQATQLFQMPKPAHFTNYRHCCECAEHDATLVAYDVNTIGVEQLGNPGWDPLQGNRITFVPRFLTDSCDPNLPASVWQRSPPSPRALAAIDSVPACA